MADSEFDLDLNKDDNNNSNARISLTTSTTVCYTIAESIVSALTTTTQWTTDPGYTESKC